MPPKRFTGRPKDGARHERDDSSASRQAPQLVPSAPLTIQVDTYKAVPKELPWDERVLRTADAALREFAELRSGYDFLASWKKANERSAPT